MPFSCEVVSQQPTIGGFRPDLVLSTDGGILILEIQLRALDRVHLYKTLEYRDLYAAETGGDPPSVALYCEQVPDKYLPLLNTHQIQLHQFERADFLRRAIRKCPKIVESYVSEASGKTNSETVEPKLPHRFEFEPVRWRPWIFSGEVRAHFNRELDRLGISKYELPGRFYHILCSDLEHHTNDPYITTVESLFAPRSWDWDYILPDRASPHYFRKPKIGLGCEITSKGNFVIFWNGWSAYDPGAEDGWKRHPSSHQYGYGRPQNELMYIRDARILDPEPRQRARFQQEGDWSSLDSILVSWIAATFREVCEIARSVCEVELVTDIHLDFSEPANRRKLDDRRFVTGWDVVPVREESRREAGQTLEGFEKEYGCSLETFVEAYNRGRAINPKSQALAPAHVTTEISRRGGTMNGREVRAVIGLLRDAEHPALSQLDLPD